LSAELIEGQRAADPEAALAEWDAAFRADIAAFLSEDLIELATDRSRPPELPPRSGLKYFCFVDASGGRHDHFTVAIGHKDKAGRFICDVLRGWGPPFDPQEVSREIAGLAKEFKCQRVHGDSYSADWIVSAFKACGVKYERSEKTRSELYLEGLPLFSRGLVSLPEHRRLGRELRLLERHVSRAGRYDEYVEGLQNAWKTPERIEADREGAVELARDEAFAASDAQRVRDTAYRSYVERITNAWKGGAA